jgi:guanylate kinase
MDTTTNRDPALRTLVVIRGPSGAGKSTVAQSLFAEVSTPVALLDLDHYRFMFRNAPGSTERPEYAAAGAAIQAALGLGFDVIFEGNFRVAENGALPLQLFDLPGAQTFAFYLEASLDETLQRHEGRADQRMTTERMRELYDFCRPLDQYPEVIIPQHSTIQQTVATIRQLAQL